MQNEEMRRRWEGIVEAVAQMDSTEPLPAAPYDAAQFLPGHTALPPDLVQALQAEDADYEKQAEAHYHAQMTREESCQAKPLPSKFISSPHDVVFSLTTPQGPNFYSGYEHARGTMNSSGASGRYGPNGTRDEASPLATLPVSSPSRLAAGLMDVQYYESLHKQPNFLPIILVPSSVTAPLQLMNIRSFLEQGLYVDPTSLFVDEESGAVYVMDAKPESVMVSPGSFLDRDKYRVAFTQFRIVDDPRLVRDWSHVCACIVEGKVWQFAGWYPDEPASACEPSQLFRRLRGFLAYFEEDKVPPETQKWRVQPLVLTRRVVKAHQHILQASVFWEQLYTFLDDHPFFRWFTVRQDV